MTYAAEIRMVHASSVDHVPIHAYGVNLSLHFIYRKAGTCVHNLCTRIGNFEQQRIRGANLLWQAVPIDVHAEGVMGHVV